MRPDVKFIQFIAAIAIAAPLCVSVQAATTNASTTQARALFADYWEASLQDNPERATRLGDARFSDRWHDLSAAATAKRKAEHLAFEKKLAAIDATKLDEEDRLSYDILSYVNKQRIRRDALFPNQPFSSDDGPFAITQMSGPQLDLPDLMRSTPLKSAHDYDMLIKRLATLPAYLDAVTAQLRAGMRLGMTPAAVSIRSVPSQFDPLLATPLENNPLYKPFARVANGSAPDIPLAEQQSLAARGRSAVQEQAIPALAKLRAFLADEYLPAARTKIAATDLPNGAVYYQAMLEASNTTSMTPAQIHQTGLDEVARIEKEMRKTIQDAGFKGTVAEFNAFLNSDPQFFFPTAEAMLASYRDIAKRFDARLPEQFATLPRLPYGIRAMLPAEGDGPEHYSRGALDGTRAGYFEANVNNLKRRASWSMESLVAHEAMPGHHLQIARAGELTTLPTFRRAYGNSGFSEGWALYAESLGGDLGMYTTPYTRYGYLSSEIFRAVRLVVDTGMHAFGMTREEAIRYMVEHAATTEAFAIAEVDRYIVWPGQATAYKLGQLRIQALRDKAKATLGPKFDVRKFNNAIVDHGGMPLEVMNLVIDRWIAQQKAAH